MVDFRYRHLSYVAVVTPDLDRSEGFLKDIVGMADGAPSADKNTRFLRCSEKHHDVMLMAGDEPGLARVSFEMESAQDLAATRTHLASIGLRPTDVRADELAVLGIDKAFRIVEPNSGLTMEFMHGMTTLAPFEPTLANITMLGHIVLATPDPVVVAKFLMDQLNFKMSDTGAGGGLLRPFPHPNHHSLGLIRSGGGNRIAHIAFMVEAYDDIGKAVPRFKKNNVPIVFGPGHHPASNSNFLYFLDRDGITWEYTFGMEQFPEHEARDARFLELGNGDSWGNVMDPLMGKVGRIMPAHELVE